MGPSLTHPPPPSSKKLPLELDSHDGRTRIKVFDLSSDSFHRPLPLPTTVEPAEPGQAWGRQSPRRLEDSSNGERRACWAWGPSSPKPGEAQNGR